MTHGREKSDSAIVAGKPTNKVEQSAAEPVEPRAEAEGNASQQSTCRAQDRESVSQALERIRAIELSGELIEFDAPCPEGFKRRCRRARHFIRFAGVVLIQTDQILGDPAIEMGSLFRDLSPTHNAFGACRCPKLGAVERYQARREKALISTEQHKGSAGPHDRGTVVASKIRNRLEVGRQPAQKPHDLDIARTLALQPARRAHFVEVAIKIKLQQVPRIVGRPSGHRRHRPPEAEASHVKTIYKRVDHPNRGIRRYIVLNRRRQQCRLTTILALNVAHEKGRIVVDAAFLI
jgi:hypothetical protein